MGLAFDERGRLYSTRTRDLMGSLTPTALAVVEAFGAVGQAARLMRWSMERWAARHGLSEARLGVLLLLRQHPDGIPLGRLAAMLEVTPRTVTGLVDHLERDGLVLRVPDPNDRRSVLARSTRSGAQLVDAIWLHRVDRQVELVDGVSPEELADLRHLCLCLVANLKRADQAVGAETESAVGSARPPAVSPAEPGPAPSAGLAG